MPLPVDTTARRCYCRPRITVATAFWLSLSRQRGLSAHLRRQTVAVWKEKCRYLSGILIIPSGYDLRAPCSVTLDRRHRLCKGWLGPQLAPQSPSRRWMINCISKPRHPAHPRTTPIRCRAQAITASTQPHSTTPHFLEAWMAERTRMPRGSTVYSYGLSYQANGNVSGYTEPNPGVSGYTNFIMGTWTYQYDNLNRLESATANQPNSLNTNYCWSYDLLVTGRRKWHQMQLSSRPVQAERHPARQLRRLTRTHG